MRLRCVMGVMTLGLLALTLAGCSTFTVTVKNDCFITQWSGGYARVTVTDITDNTHDSQNIPFGQARIFPVVSSVESGQVITVQVTAFTGGEEGSFFGLLIGTSSYNVNPSDTSLTNIDVSLKSLNRIFCRQFH